MFHVMLPERRRSPSGHLVTRRGGTHCSDFHFGCSAVPFPAPNRLFLRRIRPHQRPGGSSYLPIRTSAFTGRRTLCDVRWNALFETHFIINSPERTEDEPSLFGCFNSYRAVVTSSVLSILRDTERITIPSAFLISFTAVSPLTTATTLG